MQARLVIDFLQALEIAGWRIVRSQRERLPEPLLRVDGLLREFFTSIESCESRTGAVWFLGLEDFSVADGSGWDFLQREVSLLAAEGDPIWTAEIERFWAEHFPIAISAKDDYAYLAVASNGTVVAGRAPELESPKLLCKDFEHFLTRAVEECREQSGDIFRDWIDG